MFGIGWMEILFILVIALVVLGPDKMVETSRLLGKALREMRRTTKDFTSALSLTEEPPPSGGASRAQQDTPQEPEGSQPRDGTTGTQE